MATGARDARRLAVVEVLGYHSGWLALQSAIAVCADAVLIPGIPYDLKTVAAHLMANESAGRRPSLVIAAEGATPKDIRGSGTPNDQMDNLRKSLSPLSDLRFGEGSRVIDRSGSAAEKVALKLQQLSDRETLPLTLGQLVRAGRPTALDRQLGLSYGAAAVLALHGGTADVMVAFEASELKLVPLSEASWRRLRLRL